MVSRKTPKGEVWCLEAPNTTASQDSFRSVNVSEEIAKTTEQTGKRTDKILLAKEKSTDKFFNGKTS